MAGNNNEEFSRTGAQIFRFEINSDGSLTPKNFIRFEESGDAMDDKTQLFDIFLDGTGNIHLLYMSSNGSSHTAKYLEFDIDNASSGNYF